MSITCFVLFSGCILYPATRVRRNLTPSSFLPCQCHCRGNPVARQHLPPCIQITMATLIFIVCCWNISDLEQTDAVKEDDQNFINILEVTVVLYSRVCVLLMHRLPSHFKLIVPLFIWFCKKNVTF